jgi:MYXO-CTERM domain-containing protein
VRTITLSTQIQGSLFFGGLALIVAQSAMAQTCETDSDCRAGSSCRTEQYEVCSGDCKPGVMCPPPTCTRVESKSCVNSPCSVDADCPSSTVCYAPTYTECMGGGSACDKGAAACPAPPPPQCHQVTGDATCTPFYDRPCVADADCGTGFRCREQISTVCSGSAGTVRTGGTSASAPMSGTAGIGNLDGGTSSVECREQSSGLFACQLLEVPCVTANDCAAGLECQSNPYSAVCRTDGPNTAGAASPATTGTAGVGRAQGDGTTIAADGGSGCVTANAPSKLCAPHGYFDATSGNSGSDTGSTKADAGVEPPGQGAGGRTAGSSDGWGHERGRHPDHLRHFPFFGCAVSSGDARPQLNSWFALFGVVAIRVLRRRARRAG